MLEVSPEGSRRPVATGMRSPAGFGLNKNGDAFFQLARSVPFSIVRRESYDQEQFNALLFGQAGFLGEDLNEPYFKELKEEYQFLQHNKRTPGSSFHQCYYADVNRGLFVFCHDIFSFSALFNDRSMRSTMV